MVRRVSTTASARMVPRASTRRGNASVDQVTCITRGKNLSLNRLIQINVTNFATCDTRVSRLARYLLRHAVPRRHLGPGLRQPLRLRARSHVPPRVRRLHLRRGVQGSALRGGGQIFSAVRKYFSSKWYIPRFRVAWAGSGWAAPTRATATRATARAATT